MFTDLNLIEINKISSQDINHQKIILANEATSMLHGAEASVEAANCKNSFSENSTGENLPGTKIDKSNIEKI